MKHYIGLDISLRETIVCMIDQHGDIAAEATVASDPIGLEAGQLLAWLAGGLIEGGFPPVCVESRDMSTALKAQRIKRDRDDARHRAHDADQVAQDSEPQERTEPEAARPAHQLEMAGREEDRHRQSDSRHDQDVRLRDGPDRAGRFEARVLELLEGEAEQLAHVRPMLSAR